MKANALLKWLVPAALLGVVMIILKSWVAGSSTPSPEPPVDQGNIQLSAEQAKSLGIAGDTPRDTVATLVGQVKAMRSDMLGLKKHNDSLQTENNRLRERENSVDSRIQTALGSVTQQVDEGRRQANEARLKAEQDSRQARGLLTQLQDQLSGLAGKSKDMPIGLGLEPGDGAQFEGQHSANDALQWIEPSDAPSTSARGKTKTASALSLPTAFNSLEGLNDNAIDRGQKQLRAVTQGEHDLTRSVDRTEGAKPVYTIPENATLMGSVAMTALIGRVPVDGTVNDPYPFKVLVGPENLTANGIDLPEVAGAVMSGTASGDWTLSCVRGQVESITFVFTDGTIRTVPQPKAVASRNASTQSSNTDKIRGGLGYLSDPYGIPCIAGERRSNAQQYLGSQSLITAAGAGVAALLGDEQNNSSVISSGGSTLGVTNSTGNSALNSILSGGVSDIREWVNKLYGEAFAAVYVPPAAQVTLHLDHEITIDYEPKGRSVRHEKDHASLPDLD
ncbi:TIGR03752 family integrating conjugative element protein [Pseudomonas sp. WS 5532]|uniref:TIGR03752 family integrating conjugative element protein n=1 Tax=unclassified Pseudomonas TaxID=196821 RepID=UPI00129607EA|nr:MULTISPECIES: TIGR03752 family integrating conjugative element protein [unclassified Pseudomonas]MQT50544.1 TIGR03752 family integrating conjugative element protein [Pseudomonas sp. FSL R10-2398]NMX73762.1 TIGR03752 family integrating conjugative element protein [Pseudomonas sp. WS 5532]